jgi:hypothetical protein
LKKCILLSYCWNIGNKCNTSYRIGDSPLVRCAAFPPPQMYVTLLIFSFVY